MIGLVLVTHAGLATALKSSAEMIVGAIENCTTVEVFPDELADDIMARVVAAVEAVQSGGAIILTDLFGGTPSNMAMSFLKEGFIEVVTGVNLPMLIKLTQSREKNIRFLSAQLTRKKAVTIGIKYARMTIFIYFSAGFFIISYIIIPASISTAAIISSVLKIKTEASSRLKCWGIKKSV